MKCEHEEGEPSGRGKWRLAIEGGREGRKEGNGGKKRREKGEVETQPFSYYSWEGREGKRRRRREMEIRREMGRQTKGEHWIR